MYFNTLLLIVIFSQLWNLYQMEKNKLIFMINFCPCVLTLVCATQKGLPWSTMLIYDQIYSQVVLPQNTILEYNGLTSKKWNWTPVVSKEPLDVILPMCKVRGYIHFVFHVFFHFRQSPITARRLSTLVEEEMSDVESLTSMNSLKMAFSPGNKKNLLSSSQDFIPRLPCPPYPCTPSSPIVPNSTQVPPQYKCPPQYKKSSSVDSGWVF